MKSLEKVEIYHCPSFYSGKGTGDDRLKIDFLSEIKVIARTTKGKI